MTSETDMSTQTPNDPARQKMQLILVGILVAISLLIPSWYVLTVGIASGDETVKTIVIASMTLVIAGMGMAYSQLGLGRRVT
jgi:hypothetical protein